MWSLDKKNSYSLEEFQMFIEYCLDNNKKVTTEELLSFLRLLKAIKETE
ncbi:hypothetical protein VT91_09640 [Clostridium sporogenes]|nr:hypothetical protein [Clostridium botulinum]KRU29350.1 hypothetical protein WG71_15930 [Clostridium sporogenes]KRU33438.1 hypothetical protein VT91_09640 [Clostridium sporogenes]KRU33930.1 hypothetical protein VT28_04860 [Clostridium sporogenes]KRU43422.1 hypothetical protein VT95_16870 [Clostridium sporogenes]MBY6846677.1 hypothetical protein [Clostridium botulinum]